MQLPRLTTRRLMVAVAIVVVLLGALVERRNRFLRLADYHSTQFVGVHLVGIKNAWWGGPDPWPGAISIWTDRQGNRLTDEQSRKEDNHRALAFRYRMAARCPWLRVSPDPSPLQ